MLKKLGKKLPPKRLEELRQKIREGLIISDDLPDGIQQEFPSELRGKTLNEIRLIYGRSR